MNICTCYSCLYIVSWCYRSFQNGANIDVWCNSWKVCKSYNDGLQQHKGFFSITSWWHWILWHQSVYGTKRYSSSLSFYRYTWLWFEDDEQKTFSRKHYWCRLCFLNSTMWQKQEMQRYCCIKVNTQPQEYPKKAKITVLNTDMPMKASGKCDFRQAYCLS